MDKKNTRAYRALRLVAKKEGITVDQVVRKIEEAISEAYLTAVRENDQAVLTAWAEIPCQGNLPTVLELVTYLGEKVLDKGLS